MIRLCEIRGTRLECSFLSAAFFLVMVIAGAYKTAILLVLSLALHELCHAIAAHALGYNISSIEILPFGFTARIAQSCIPLFDDTLIAAAGPLCSLIVGLSAQGIANLYADNAQTIYAFASMNVTLGAVNLIPALPLDGGRLLLCTLKRILPERTAAYICAVLSFLLTALLTIGFVYNGIKSDVWNISLPMFAVLLAVCAIREIQRLMFVKAEGVLRRARSILAGHEMNGRTIFVHESILIKAAVKKLRYGVFTEFVIVNDALEPIGRVNENTLIHASASKADNAIALLIDPYYRR